MPDSKVLIVGTFNLVNGQERNHIAKLNSDGTLDENFSATVDSWTNPSGTELSFLRSVTLQPDGKILIAGKFNSVNGVPRSNIARLNSDGTLDETFATGTFGGINNFVAKVISRQNGQIVICGRFDGIGAGTGWRRNIALLNNDGTLGENTGINPNAVVYSIAIQEDEKIIVGGVFSSYGFTCGEGCYSSPSSKPAYNIFRLNSDFTIDLSFFPVINQSVEALKIQNDGKIIIGGRFTLVNGEARNRLARLNPDGSIDSGFIDPNFSTTSIGNVVLSLAIQEDGKILAGGSFTSVQNQNRWYMVRLNQDGSIDSLFGTNFYSFLSTSDTYDNRPNGIFSISIDSNQNIFASGMFNRVGGNGGGTGGTDTSGNSLTVRDSIAKITDNGVLI
jgi:uncharacterized delta-60 repeat protein